jgi:adenylate cyclase
LPTKGSLDDVLKPLIDMGTSRRRRVERRLAAVLALDVAGYSLLMGRDDEGTHQRIGRALGRVRRHIRRGQGQIFSFTGDGVMAAFPSSAAALRSAIQIQNEARALAADVEPHDRIAFRIGINVGEILVQGGRVGGDAVNIAARLEQLSEVGDICITAAVHDQAGRNSDVWFASLGPLQLKNIRQPVTVYRVVLSATPEVPVSPPPIRDSRPWVAVLPFRNAGDHLDETYFADGIVEDVIVSLTGLRELVVISRSSTMALAERSADIREIGHTLGVGYIVTGSIRRSSQSARVTVELVEVESGSTLWANAYDSALGDLFEVQDQIVRRIVAGVAPHIQEEELRRALRRPPCWQKRCRPTRNSRCRWRGVSIGISA